jgi:hypothetical protein
MNDIDQAEYRKLMASFKKIANIKECVHHKKDECKGDIKQSHSIQRNGKLSIIEGDSNSNQCLYRFTGNIPSMKRVMEDLKPLGKKKQVNRSVPK